MAEKKKATFEASLAELEEIISQLEQGDVPLEEALDKFKRGVTLSKVCQETLTNAEKTLAKIMNDNGEEVPFEESGNEE